MAAMQDFSIQLKCLKFVGFGNVVEEKHKLFLRFLQRLNISIISYCVFAEIRFVVRNLKDIFAAVECFSFIATVLITFPKIISFYYYNENFRDMLVGIKELSDKGESQNPSKKFKNL